MLIEQLIGELLLRHNCVVVPSFGGFVARQTSAVVDSRNGVMLPPGKSLLFNKQLINNDGLLIASYAQSANVSYDEAAAEIQSKVIEWQQKLHAGERITIEKVGYLFLDQEKNIGFEQDRFFNLLLSSYGLGKVHFVSEEDIRIVARPEINPVEKTETATRQDIPVIEMIPAGEPVIGKIPDEIPVLPLPAVKTTVKFWKYAAAAALIPIAFYSYWIPVKTRVLESGVFAIQDFNPFHTAQEGTYDARNWTFKLDTARMETETLDEMITSLPENVTILSYPFDNDLFIPVRTGNQPETTAATVQTSAETTIEPMAVSGSGYHLIAGCFGSESNAQNFVKDLKSKGMDAYVVDFHQGLYRVSAGKAADASLLQNAQSKIQALDIPGSWILKK